MIRNKGFTLLEMVISITLFLIILAGLYLVFYGGNISWYYGVAQMELQSQARTAMYYLSRDIRQASTIGNFTLQSTADSQTINTPEGAVTYSIGLVPGSTTKTLERDNIPIAKNIKRVSVFSNNSVDITVTTQRDVFFGGSQDFTLNDKVSLRNQ